MSELLVMLRNTDVKCTLFIIPHGLSDPHASARNYLDLLCEAQRAQQEIGLHGYNHARNEFGFIVPIPFPSLAAQCARIESGLKCLKIALGESPVGFRAPCYRHSRLTLKALEQSGIKYDSSKTVFKPTQGMRFRFRTGIEPKVTRIGNLFEIPVTGDYAANLNDDTLTDHLARARADFEWVRTRQGVFVVNTHLQTSGSLAIVFIRRLIDELRDDTEFVRLRDLVS